MTAESNKPVQGVKVELLDPESKQQLQFSMSDSNGFFGFDKVKPGKYIIQASA